MQRSTRIDWTGFIKLTNDEQKIEAAMCKSCHRVLRSYSQKRFQQHREVCKRVVEDDDVDASDATKSKRFRLDDGKDDADMEYAKDVIDKKLAMFFFACSIPFKTVENPYFLDFVKTLCKLNFVYTPPCRQTLGGSILYRVHNDIVEEKKQILQGTDSVMLVDGWRNKSVNRKFLVFTIRNINTPQLYLTFNDTSLEREDGESLAENINNAIEFAKDQYDTNVFAIVTDNDAKITCGGRLAKNCDGNSLIQSTCNSHSGNLLIKSFVEEDFTKKIRDIINTFREPKLDSLLIRQGGTKLKNYPDTRFCYLRDTCESILKNLEKMRNICLLEDIAINEEILENIFDNNFRSKLTEIVENVTPICKLINKCQDPQYNVADGTQLWMELQIPSSNYDDIIAARIRKAIWPVGYAANLLHNKYQGGLLNENQINEAEIFLQNFLDPDALRELDIYKREKHRFTNLSEKCNSPISFWSWCSFHLPNLSKYAIRLMLIPASTALIESLFSHWTYVHTLYRNRMLNDKSGLLLDVYHSLKFMNTGKYKINKNCEIDLYNILYIIHSLRLQ